MAESSASWGRIFYHVTLWFSITFWWKTKICNSLWHFLFTIYTKENRRNIIIYHKTCWLRLQNRLLRTGCNLKYIRKNSQTLIWWLAGMTSQILTLCDTIWLFRSFSNGTYPLSYTPILDYLENLHR